MSEEDTLLDTFVDVAARHLDKTENDIKEFIGRIRKSFGDVGVIDVKSSGKALIDPKAVSDAKAAIGSLRSELLKFSAEKNEVSIGVRLLGSKDITSQFQAIQSQVAAARDRFNDAEIGVAGNDVRAAELASIAASREHLAVLEHQIQAELKLKGLADVYATKALAIRNVTEQAQRFTLALQEVNSVVSKSKSPELKTDLLIASNAAKEIKQTLSSSLASGDLVGAEKAIAGLNEVEKRLKAIGAKASQQVNINTNVKDLVSQFNVAVQKAQSLNQLLQFESAGKLNIEQKLGLAKVEKEVRDIVNEFRNLSKATKITQADFKRLQILATNFSEATESMNAMQRSVTNVSKSTNQLGNNAYQVGQAFEDAAVGFSLDGFRGAFRGAANNVNFLVQNLSQAGSLTSILGARTAALLPLYLGIGTAAAFLLPVLYDWWKSLDDIEDKTKELADKLKREFNDIRFDVSLKIDSFSALKTIADADDVVEAIEELIRQAEEGDRLTIKLSAELDAASKIKLLRDFDEIFDGIRKNLQESIRNIQEQVNAHFGDEVDISSDPTVKALLNIESAFDSFIAARRMAFEDSSKGIVNPGAISTARESLQFIIDGYQRLIDAGVLSEKELENVRDVMEAVNSELSQFNEDAKEIEIINALILKRDIEAAVGSAEKLTRELEFQQKINAGIATEEDRILFKMKEELLATEKLNAELLKKNGNTVENQKLAERNTANTKLKQEIELLKRIHEIETELAEKKRKQNESKSSTSSELGDPGAIAFGVLDAAKDPELKAIEDLTEELRKLREALEENRRLFNPFVGPIDPRTKEQKDAFDFVGPIDTRAEEEAFKRRQKEFVEQRRREQADFDARITNETIAAGKNGGKFVGPIDPRITEPPKFKGPIDPRTEEEKRRFEDEKNRINNETIAAKKTADAEARAAKEAKDAELAAIHAESEEIKRNSAQREADHQRQREANEQQKRWEEEFDRNQRESIKKADQELILQEGAVLREEAKKLQEIINSGSQTSEQDAQAAERIKGLIEEAQRISREFGVQPSFSPEDIPAQVNAQAQANARAMENTNFTSTTLQTLIATSNEILGKLNENVSKLDVSSRFT